MSRIKPYILAWTLSLPLLFSATVISARGQANQSPPAIDAATRSQVVEGVIKNLNQLYVFPEVAVAMERSLRDRIRKGEYDRITTGIALAQKLTSDLQEVSKDTHLQVRYSARPLPPLSEGAARASDEERERLRQALASINNGFVKAERLRGNVGYLDLDTFVDPEFGGETAAAAMNFLSNADALIVDLRYNTGGDSRMVALLSSYLFSPAPVHLTDIYSRTANFTKQSWTLPYVPGKRFVGKDVYVLTSKRTHSAAEEFAYNLQSLKRATIVGETTRGGAHPTGRYRINEHFGIAIPTARAINPITKTNWEGTGVKPDVEVPFEEAPRAAHLSALKRLLEKNANSEKAGELRQHIDSLQKESVTVKSPQEPTRAIDPKILETYVGQYETPMGLLTITIEGGKLLVQPAGDQKVELTPEAENQFSARAVGARVTFVKDSQGRVTHLLISLNGQEMQGKKIK